MLAISENFCQFSATPKKCQLAISILTNCNAYHIQVSMLLEPKKIAEDPVAEVQIKLQKNRSIFLRGKSRYILLLLLKFLRVIGPLIIPAILLLLISLFLKLTVNNFRCSRNFRNSEIRSNRITGMIRGPMTHSYINFHRQYWRILAKQLIYSRFCKSTSS